MPEIAFNPIHTTFPYRLKGQGGISPLPLRYEFINITETIPIKLCTVIVLLKATRMHNDVFKNMTYDARMTSLSKTMENFDHHKIMQNHITQWKGIDESFPKM